MGVADVHKLAAADGRGIRIQRWIHKPAAASGRGRAAQCKNKAIASGRVRTPEGLEQWPWERTKAPRYQCEGTLYACFCSDMTQGLYRNGNVHA